MRKPLLLLFPSAMLIFLVSPVALATCHKPGQTYPPVQGTTHIESVSPQVGLAGVARVYIQGYCFADGQGTGSVTLNGETVTNIVTWTDAEIEFIPPLDATTGNLVVTSASYGSDSTANEAACVSSPPDYCGNDKLNANFTVLTPNSPAYFFPANSLHCNSSQPCPLIAGVQSYPQYLAGTWYYDDGGQTMTLTLTQGAQNPDGTWPITGTEVSDVCNGQFSVTGTLDQYGGFNLFLPCVEDNENCIEWLLLGSGDVTSQGFGQSGP
ncbi:MAG TPA: IPT/TIG domain-containing protein [Candidatus Acidoferrales bacterium]|nr:IPT/TIG domain-containing protein [Candidatus Acidoferrales bacterium]